jgi:hypothetical protein
VSRKEGRKDGRMEGRKMKERGVHGVAVVINTAEYL